MTPTDTPPETIAPKHWQDAQVLLLAHGSEGTPEGAAFVRQQADTLRQRNLFGEVSAAFLRDTPHPRDIVQNSRYRDIYVVPFMVADGYSLDVMIPDALALDGALTETMTEQGRKRVHLCRPIGTHRAVRQWSLDIVSAVMEDFGLWKDEPAVLVLCHGTRRHQGGRYYAEQVVRDITNHKRVSTCAMLFLEEEPEIRDWRTCVANRYVIALPYLMTAGRHGAYDIPEALGIDSTDETFHTGLMQGSVMGPYDVAGRKLWYGPLLGTLSAIPDIIIDRVADWDKSVHA